MQKREQLYEGKAKKIYRTDDENILWISYKDDATAFNGEKKDRLEGKARLNNEISALIFTKLNEQGLESHFVERLSETDQLVKKVEIVPIEVVVRNLVAGSMAKRLGLEEGVELKQPIVEFYYKDDALGDPLITEDHIALLEAATADEVEQLREMAQKVNKLLIELFNNIGVRLVDFKLEFGRAADGELLLADEISPDTCRLWDSKTNERFDKDLFRRNLGNLQAGYQEILTRLGGPSCTK
ncbi:phosphoribosylaminoimidazolesuccinocarboxamide synthase [Alkalihalophilus lindianensis]|uniref:Phosphoribosylaminoimidazole-succinocarboxamide synthase n=1 Tax=Alkalihalophilus lindianensis TaxID=1630542 RepID=A0ABU3XCQ2_9BACI|nr:phosphoribosylaminoimidazolesuccinocarboxamide synthase [Alkalihalophilus lindianensis]MDV2685673.1 phosphoribosylaminoimidazolesuccinocarboxamide synthase [Alkalihalophilus lindianensis]